MQLNESITSTISRIFSRLNTRSNQKDFRNSVMALVDQALVSGTNFATTVLIGRTCGAEELGIYTLGFTLLIIFNVIQEALIATPYTIYGNRLRDEERSRYAGSALIHTLILGLIIVSAMLIGYAGTHFFWPAIQNETLLLMIAAIITFELMRQFARRFAFAHLKLKSAVLIDFIVASIHLSGLALLIATGHLSAYTAMAFTGLSTAIATGIWIARQHSAFKVSMAAVWKDMRKNFQLGSWIFGGRMVSVMNNNVMHWLLAFLLGTMATGVFSACMTVVMFSNPLFIGIGNILTARVSAAYAQQGLREVRSVVFRAVVGLGCILSVYALLLLLYGGSFLHLLYNGDEFLGKGSIVAVLSLHMLVSGLNMPFHHGLQAIERPDINLKMNAIGLSVTLCSAFILLIPFGVMGAAISLVFGNIVSSTIHALIFLRMISQMEKLSNTGVAAIG